MQESLAFLDAAVKLLHVRGAVCRCTVLLEKKPLDTLRAAGSSMTSFYDVKKQRYNQNFLLCNNNEITPCIADLFKSFCEEVYPVCIFKGSAPTNYRKNGKFNYVFVGR